tara:strand:+ start:322 stop:594 length:273 start_codon:yes stop_codon:yes gene_type:complete
MGLFEWFSKNDSVDDTESSVVVKSLRSKGGSRSVIPITVRDIRKGSVKDSRGYENDVVLFLRKNKATRPKTAKRELLEETKDYKIVRFEK